MQHHWKTYRERSIRTSNGGDTSSSSMTSQSMRRRPTDASNTAEAMAAANATGAMSSIAEGREFLEAPVSSGYGRAKSPSNSNKRRSVSSITALDNHDPDDSEDDDDDSIHDQRHKNNNSNNSSRMIDPPPLDEALVTYLLALIGRFLYQTHLIEEANDQYTSTPSEYPIDTLSSAIGGHMDQKTLSITLDIYKTAGRVLYYVSASNWSTYYAKIKNAVHILGAMGEGSELNPPEIRMLEFSCLNRQRVQLVLSGKDEGMRIGSEY